jgi:hypothetical protein
LSQSVTSRSDKFLNWKYLQSIQEEFCVDLVRDSTEALRWLEEQSKFNNQRKNGFSWDFSALYDNLTPSLVKEALAVAIKELRPQWTEGFTKWIMDLVNHSLDSSFAKYGRNWYKGLVGIPTGGSLSVTLANIAVYYVLRKIIYLNDDIPEELLGLKRFVDDICGLWTGSRESFELWSDRVNEELRVYGLSIKDKSETVWDFNEPGQDTVFLDIRFNFDANVGLLTDVNIKKTDARVYLHFSSHHPKQMFPSIVYSQALRLRRIINNKETLQNRLNEIKGCFLRSGYPRKMVQSIIDDVLTRPRVLEYNRTPNKPPAPVLWVQTFSAVTELVHELASDANKIIQLSPAWKDEKHAIGIVSRRGRNLGDMLLKRKSFALEDTSMSTGTTRCTPRTPPGQKKKRGRPCESCTLMSNQKKLISNVTKKTYVTPSGDCKSSRLIYGAQCLLCKIQYAGQTVNKLRTRISGHRSHMNRTPDIEPTEDTDEASLANHLKNEHGMDSVELFNVMYSFTILQIDPPDLDKAEQQWISQLVTMHPYGLNIEKPRGVADSLITMCKKSSSQR